MKKLKQPLMKFSILLIPILTILLGTKKSPFQYTLSMVGNWFDHRTNLIIWGVLTGIILTLFTIEIYKKTKFKNKKAHRFLYLSGIFLILSVITPTISTQPIPIELRNIYIGFHEIFGIIFVILLFLSFYLFSKYTATIDKKLSNNLVALLLTTAGIPLIALTFFGMTGIFEITFFILVSIFLIITDRNVHKHLEKEKITY